MYVCICIGTCYRGRTVSRNFALVLRPGHSRRRDFLDAPRHASIGSLIIERFFKSFALFRLGFLSPRTRVDLFPRGVCALI